MRVCVRDTHVRTWLVGYWRNCSQNGILETLVIFLVWYTWNISYFLNARIFISYTVCLLCCIITGRDVPGSLGLECLGLGTCLGTSHFISVLKVERLRLESLRVRNVLVLSLSWRFNFLVWSQSCEFGKWNVSVLSRC